MGPHPEGAVGSAFVRHRVLVVFAFPDVDSDPGFTDPRVVA